jgi:hypothetical protein
MHKQVTKVVAAWYPFFSIFLGHVVKFVFGILYFTLPAANLGHMVKVLGLFIYLYHLLEPLSLIQNVLYEKE